MLHICALPHSNVPLATAFNCRRVLENSDHYLVEVKHTDHTDFLSHFHWLKISKDFVQIDALNLKTGDSTYQVEERFFEEGYLKFNATNGIFIEKFNSGQHHYQLLNDPELDSTFMQLIEAHFSEVKTVKN